ncbi:hypothetical protein GII33_13910 [Gordonia pseudamarae]|jgi:hypothetical protein|uniref:Uncharacterized protein n=1 Tax=Gordonia pseudamarae TaxID=2831662 RepID=A0ABX6IIR1_9ACTN|nr:MULTISPECIES: hypothetical protein [Gordonia]MBD0022547.1 hypothetical protein [Gordonia sp. (in: high G+C Gram-positive bacteria)]QHN26882.1 hypothetical protein GII33_13910 [Gordonia pseudamarae]QHN35772.1 hypothetical protein GII31_13735 [Gordonia pseudamarae]
MPGDDDERPEYAEDFPDGTGALPEAVREFLAGERAYWRQVRGDPGPEQPDHAEALREIEKRVALETGYGDWVGMDPTPRLDLSELDERPE